MAGMKAGDIRRQKILGELLEKECCTYEYLMTNYQISERCMQLDIKELCKQGYQIKGVKAKQGYVLKKGEEAPQQKYYETSDAQKIRKLFIMLILQDSKGYTVSEIENKIKQYNFDGIVADVKTLQVALDELVSARMIKKDGEKYVVSTKAPIQLALSTADALELLNLLEMCAKGHVHEKVLNDIRVKMTIALFNEPEEATTPSSYVVYNRQYEESEKLESILDELNKYPFEEKQLDIEYTNHYKKTVKTRMAVGNIVYSVDKDRVYLLGDCNQVPSIIYYGSIQSIQATDVANESFQNRFYTDITESMFGISLEPITHVKVQFENKFNIKDKVGRLLVNRKDASITEAGEYFIYEDDISGLYDFARFLRGFGFGCRVLEPQSLKDIMRESAKRILTAYEGLEGEE